MRTETLALEETVDELRRRVAWQVATAYGLPLEEPAVAAEVEPVAEPRPLPLPRPAPQPEPEPELEPAAETPLRFPLLTDLERLVAMSAAAHPERAAEWRWYLFYLRQFADINGTLPSTFALLVDTVFGSLLSAEGVEVRVQ